MLIVDAHEDLAWNIIAFDRNYTRPAAETRRLEAGGLAPQKNGDTLLGWPEYQRGRVAVVFSTLFAAPASRSDGAWEDRMCYSTSLQANRLYNAQIDAYERLVDEHPDRFRLIYTQGDLQEVVSKWEQAEPASEPVEKDETGEEPEQAGEKEAPNGNPVGLVILMEGAEGVLSPAELDEWWRRGVRLIGPAWAGTRFCGGTRDPGPLTKEGFELLEGMSGLGFILDLSHMDEAAALQALDAYPGTIVATHANAYALLEGLETNRHLSDRVIRGLIEREGMMGIVPFNAFLKPGWKRGDRREEVPLQRVVAHIDYVCQMAGDALHVGIGSDFDGGFGLQSVPPEVDSVADLQKLARPLAEKGYTEDDIAAILGRNWIIRLQRNLPASI